MTTIRLTEFFLKETDASWKRHPSAVIAESTAVSESDIPSSFVMVARNAPVTRREMRYSSAASMIYIARLRFKSDSVTVFIKDYLTYKVIKSLPISYYSTKNMALQAIFENKAQNLYLYKIRTRGRLVSRKKARRSSVENALDSVPDAGFTQSLTAAKRAERKAILTSLFRSFRSYDPIDSVKSTYYCNS